MNENVNVSMHTPTGVDLIAKEREEQLGKHGRTLTYDSTVNADGQLLTGAIRLLQSDYDETPPTGWDKAIWNKMQGKDGIGRLTVAGALIAAEIDRLNATHTLGPLKYGLVVVDKRNMEESKDGMVNVLHFCGYWREPTQEDVNGLMHELATTPEFGVMDIIEHIGIYDATPELVAEYNADIISGKISEIPEEEIKAEELKQ
jgi:hypothetical protein